MGNSIKDYLVLRELQKSELYEGDSDPHMWDYWRGKKGFQEALEEYYPGTLRHDEEIKILFYVWKATEQNSLRNRIDEIMSQRSDAWREKYSEELGI